MPGHKLGWDRKKEAVAGERSPYRMTRKFRRFGNVCAPFPGLLLPVRNTFTPLMITLTFYESKFLVKEAMGNSILISSSPVSKIGVVFICTILNSRYRNGSLVVSRAGIVCELSGSPSMAEKCSLAWHWVSH